MDDPMVNVVGAIIAELRDDPDVAALVGTRVRHANPLGRIVDAIHSVRDLGQQIGHRTQTSVRVTQVDPETVETRGDVSAAGAQRLHAGDEARHGRVGLRATDSGLREAVAQRLECTGRDVDVRGGLRQLGAGIRERVDE